MRRYALTASRACSAVSTPESIRTPKPSIMAVTASTICSGVLGVNRPAARPSSTMSRSPACQQEYAVAVACWASVNAGAEPQNWAQVIHSRRASGDPSSDLGKTKKPLGRVRNIAEVRPARGRLLGAQVQGGDEYVVL